MHDLRVAGLTEHAGEPFQFAAKEGHGFGVVQQFPIRRQHRAHPSGGNSHLVDRIVGVLPYERVLILEVLHLLPEVSEHDSAGGSLTPRRGRRLCRGRIQAQGAREFGLVGGGPDADTGKPVLHGLKQGPGTSDEFNLPLPPAQRTRFLAQ